MAHRAKVLPGMTFRLQLAVVAPYNGELVFAVFSYMLIFSSADVPSRLFATLLEPVNRCSNMCYIARSDGDLCFAADFDGDEVRLK